MSPSRARGGATEPAKEDSPLVDDEAGIPAGVVDAVRDFAKPVGGGSRRDVAARVRCSEW
jgi:hypothetical protein